MILTYTLDLTDPRCGVLGVLTLTLTITDPLGGDFLKSDTTCIPDPNRSTSVNFVDVNDRYLYIVKVKVKERIVLREIHPRTTDATCQWDHTVLSATRQR